MNDAALTLAKAIIALVEDSDSDDWDAIPRTIQRKLEGNIYSLAEQVVKAVQNAG